MKKPTLVIILSLIVNFVFFGDIYAQEETYTLKNAKEYFELAETGVLPEGVSTNEYLKKACIIYNEFAKKGNADAQYMMGRFACGFMNKEDGSLTKEQEFEKSLEWYLLAANQGHAEAQFVVGSYFSSGYFLSGHSSLSQENNPNPQEAFKWFKASALQGHDRAMEYLAHYYTGNLNVTDKNLKYAVMLEAIAEIFTIEGDFSVEEPYSIGAYVDFEKDKDYWRQMWLKSVNNSELYGTCIPKRLFDENHKVMASEGNILYNFSGKLSVEEREEVKKMVSNWRPNVSRFPDQNNITIEEGPELEFALKATPPHSEIKPDGKSTLEITGQLYSYTPGDNSSSKPVSGKTLTFEIQEMDGVKPGTLSLATAVTDANGVAKVIYTAPTAEQLEKMQAFNRISTAVTIRNEETGTEDIAYITFQTDNGKMRIEPGIDVISNTGYIPPDNRYPALITADFQDENLEPIANTEVTFSIKEDNPVGMLRSSNGQEGTIITTKTDASGIASVQYYYAAASPPEKPITETIEAKTKNMAIPLKAYISIGLNIVLENAISGYEGSTDINAGEKVPLKITVRDEWNPTLDLAQIMNYWGSGNEAGNNRLYVKLEIKKQGFMPTYMLDYLGSENFPEPEYEELLYPKTIKDGLKNLMYISEYSQNKSGFPTVMPLFSGTNNYEIMVSLVDEKGNPVFESQHPRQTAFVSIPTGLPANSYAIWFATNPLGPHTEMSKFARLLLSTVTFGKFGGLGSLLSLADAAFAINNGDADALANIMLSEIKGQISGDIEDVGGLKGELFAEYNKMSITEQYISYALNSESDMGLIAEMESKILSEIAAAGIDSDRQLVILKGDGNQKLLIDGESKPESKSSNFLKDNVKISISGVDEETKDFINKIGKKKKKKEIPCVEGSFNYEDKLNTISLKNGNVSIYSIPKEMKVISVDATEMKIY
jgi:hypothetical protein